MRSPDSRLEPARCHRSRRRAACASHLHSPTARPSSSSEPWQVAEASCDRYLARQRQSPFEYRIPACGVLGESRRNLLLSHGNTLAEGFFLLLVAGPLGVPTGAYVKNPRRLPADASKDEYCLGCLLTGRRRWTSQGYDAISLPCGCPLRALRAAAFESHEGPDWIVRTH